MDLSQYTNAALVESGGGSKGAYQIGAGEVLAEHGFKPKIFTGISVGAINATLGAQVGLAERGKRFWYTQEQERKWVRKKDIYKSFNKLKAGYRFLRDGGALSNGPVHERIKKEIDPEAIQRRRVVLEVGAVNLHTLQYKTFRPGDFHFKTGLLASTNVPAVVPPEEIRGQLWADGGIRNLTPIGDALKYDPEFIVIIVLRPIDLSEPVDDIPRFAGFKGLGVIKRTTDAMSEEIAYEDLKQFLRLNEAARLYEEATGQTLVIEGRPVRNVPFLLIQPEENLGDGQDFSSEVLEQRYLQGRKDAETAIRQAGG